MVSDKHSHLLVKKPGKPTISIRPYSPGLLSWLSWMSQRALVFADTLLFCTCNSWAAMIALALLVRFCSGAREKAVTPIVMIPVLFALLFHKVRQREHERCERSVLFRQCFFQERGIAQVIQGNDRRIRKLC